MIGFNALCALFDRDDEIPTKTSHQRKKSDAGMRKETNITNMYICMGWDSIKSLI